jgi:hypothetical protein
MIVDNQSTLRIRINGTITTHIYTSTANTSEEIILSPGISGFKLYPWIVDGNKYTIYEVFIFEYLGVRAIITKTSTSTTFSLTSPAGSPTTGPVGAPVGPTLTLFGNRIAANVPYYRGGRPSAANTASTPRVTFISEQTASTTMGGTVSLTYTPSNNRVSWTYLQDDGTPTGSSTTVTLTVNSDNTLTDTFNPSLVYSP